ncbi:uncharacterized protein LOC121505130 isoform X2 [Cheilinus undulatus]|uniref:uncharacterized protein LOC121505130 isoform X2 n=1 Tax=Cheilinus undulatus TaxID=241271 RepID=UPI001BD5272B|nr:uncharacterized protein LOC121505130 isoform X2 [Cheilinus undulatus]
MRIFLLLLLSLVTGADPSYKVTGCQDGWIDFTCQNPNGNNYHTVSVMNQSKPIKTSSKSYEWEIKDRVSMYHDKSKGNLRVIIKQLQQEDDGQWRCKFGSRNSFNTLDLKVETDESERQVPYVQTAYKKAKTTITCEYPGDKNESEVQIFCKERGSICEDILSTESGGSNGSFSLIETDKGFNVSISDVNSEHGGVYWCGLKSGDGRYRAGVSKIQLKIQTVTDFKKRSTVGETLDFFFKYSADESEKFVCKGEDPSLCHPLISTSDKNTRGRFTMRVDKKENKIWVTLTAVNLKDNGTYWCGEKSTDGTKSHTFTHRMLLTVAQPTPVPPEDHRKGGGLRIVIGVICAAVLLQVFMLTSFLFYKRCSKSRSTGNGTAEQNTREDYIYEEIQERVPNPDSRYAAKTIYAKVDFPNDPSASLHYSAISFQQSPYGAGSEGLTLKPSSSACEYSAVKANQSPDDSAVRHPAIPSEDPLYSTVSKTQCG